MQLSTSKILYAAAVAALGLTQQALADDQGGSLTALAGTKATDYYIVNCFATPAAGDAKHLFFQIKDTTAGNNSVGVTVINNNGPAHDKARTTIDATGGDAVYSEAQTLAGGNGDYIVAIFHTGTAATESYSLAFHCETNAGVHAGTSIVRLSNQ